MGIVGRREAAKVTPDDDEAPVVVAPRRREGDEAVRLVGDDRPQHVGGAESHRRAARGRERPERDAVLERAVPLAGLGDRPRGLERGERLDRPVGVDGLDRPVLDNDGP